MRQLCSFLDTQQPGNRFACSYGRVCSCFLLLFHFPSFFHLLHFPRSLSPNNSGERLTLTPSESDQPEVKGLSNQLLFQCHANSIPLARDLPRLYFLFFASLPSSFRRSADFFSFRMANPCRIFPRLITERQINMYDGSRPRISREKTQRGE